MMAHLALARTWPIIPIQLGPQTTTPTLPLIATAITISAPVHVTAVVVPTRPKRKRLMISYGVSDKAAKRLAIEAQSLVGDLNKCGSGGEGWRTVDWSVVQVRRGDCACVGAGGLRRSLRIPILEQKRQDNARLQACATQH
jgi:hypothetical protein